MPWRCRSARWSRSALARASGGALARSAADAARKEAETAEAAVARATEAHRGAAAWQAQAVQALADKRSAAQAAREKASEAGHVLATLRSERTALDRRIAEVMQIEKIKGRVTGLPGLKSLLGCLQAPEPRPAPGRTTP